MTASMGMSKARLAALVSLALSSSSLFFPEVAASDSSCRALRARYSLAGCCGNGNDPEPCICTKEYRPVCCEGTTYSNSCVAGCSGCEGGVKGECPTPCLCTKEYRPVCCDGTTYGNSCEARCDSCTDWTEGECGCTCPEVFDRVCCGGIEYHNACFARCLGGCENPQACKN